MRCTPAILYNTQMYIHNIMYTRTGGGRVVIQKQQLRATRASCNCRKTLLRKSVSIKNGDKFLAPAFNFIPSPVLASCAHFFLSYKCFRTLPQPHILLSLKCTPVPHVHHSFTPSSVKSFHCRSALR